MSDTAAIEATAMQSSAVKALYIPKELWMAAIFALAFAYLMFSENGLVLAQNWEPVHEFFHDGRHVFGVPCH